MRIGELAARTGVSVRALRYYEEQKLLGSVRSPSGQRLYSNSAVGRVELIQQLYAAGLSSRTILGILPCVVTGEVTPELLNRLTTERDRINSRIDDLTATRDRLDTIIVTSTKSVTAGKPCAPPAAAPPSTTPSTRKGPTAATRRSPMR
ncbi:MerR family transcriptional regulator [Kibdelosporangium aridum]|uniref:DNA-binding transcriptional regulator, MerR family n=1 Tax=Kibdelosporangium aridum TaxID=2030 RepID=A0A1W2FZL9_KIBAR|nr:MerR family transcriptional regulator [Kibdelosporangium aridum]SMD27407.1 DNA-binding transcriptional regulator, MerR family [Kibdelosporangium aridum]